MRASGTSLTGLFGVGPVVAAVVIGEVRDVTRFPGRDCFAAYDGTAPIEVSPGSRKVCRLSRRGNRRLNHAIHMAAVTQVSHRHSEGRTCFDKKLAEGKTPKEALRSLKRKVSDAVFTRLRADARRARARGEDPGGQTGNGSAPGAAGSHPARRLFGKATPGSPAHPTAAAADTEPAGTPGLFLDSCPVLAGGEAPGPGGAPAAKRGRTTWTRRKTTATLGREEGPRRKLTRPPLTQRGFDMIGRSTVQGLLRPRPEWLFCTDVISASHCPRLDGRLRRVHPQRRANGACLKEGAVLG